VLLYEAETVTEVETSTPEVLTANVALVAPAGTVMLEGTLAAPLLAASATCTPPVGAGPVNVTVPMEEFPPATLVGFRESEDGERDAGTGESSKSKTAGLGAFCETATNFAAEIICQIDDSATSRPVSDRHGSPAICWW
jgi:hypothetical protein